MELYDLFFIYVFLPLCLIAYFVAGWLDKRTENNYGTSTTKARNIVLVVFSLIFYAWGEPVWVFLLIGSALFNWLIGQLAGASQETARGKLVLAIGIVVNLGLLLGFKYTGFFIRNLNGIFGSTMTVPKIIAPLAISFYTFSAISYIIDCYWGKCEAQRSFFKVLLYLCMFPKLLCGPITRYGTVERELSERSSTKEDICEGAMRAIVGLAKKILIANNLWTIVDTYFDGSIAGLSVLGTWFTVIAYTLYVYYDFSGYSDIAIGLGRMFGFRFDENFNYPFMCTSIAEFWQRWHISLGTFFRDYLLYIPIFGRNFKYFNLFLVWFCTGMWHGASWNYIIWGLFFGVFIFIEQKIGKKRLKKLPLWWKHTYTKLLLIIGFGIFCFTDFGQLGQFLLNISGLSLFVNKAPFADSLTWSSFVKNIILIAAAIIGCFPILPKIKNIVYKNRSHAVYASGRIIALVFCAALLITVSVLQVASTNSPFLYTNY